MGNSQSCLSRSARGDALTRARRQTCRWACAFFLFGLTCATTIVLANEPPVANDQSFLIQQDRSNPLFIFLDVDESFGPGPFGVEIVDDPDNPGMGPGPYHGNEMQAPDGGPRSRNYVVDPGYWGDDYFHWRYFDGEFWSNVARASIYVNQRPLAFDQSEYTLQDQPIDIVLSFEDDMVPGPLDAMGQRPPDERGTVVYGEFPMVTYTPAPGFAGEETFRWSLFDGMLESEWATVTVAVNTVPVAFDRDLLAHAGLPLEFRVQFDDSGPVSDPMVSVADPPQHGTLVQLTDDGRFSYTGHLDFTGVDEFTFFVDDGVEVSNEARISIEMTPEPDFELGIGFPLTGSPELRDFSTFHYETLHARHTRTSVDWSVIQPIEDGPFDWTTVTKNAEWHFQNDFDWTMTIHATAPNWACDFTKKTPKGCIPLDMADFRAYVQALLGHIFAENGRLPAQVQFGNEWGNSESPNRWYPGSAEEYVTQMNIVYSEVKAISPSTPVVIGGLTGFGHVGQMGFCEGFLDEWEGRDSDDRARYCSGAQYQLTWKQRSDFVMQNANYDVLDLHLYTDPENWRQKVYALKNVIVPWERRHLPVVATEFGGPNQFEEPIDEPYQAMVTEEYLASIVESGLAEALFFKLVESGAPDENFGFSGLIDVDRFEQGDPNPEKLNYWVFRDFNDKLVNGPFTQIQRGP